MQTIIDNKAFGITTDEEDSISDDAESKFLLFPLILKKKVF